MAVAQLAFGVQAPSCSSLPHRLPAGRPNPWAEVYDPSRVPPMKSLAEIADEGLTTTVGVKWVVGGG